MPYNCDLVTVFLEILAGLIGGTDMTVSTGERESKDIELLTFTKIHLSGNLYIFALNAYLFIYKWVLEKLGFSFFKLSKKETLRQK